MLQRENLKMYWLGHASFRFEVGNLAVYIDPFRINANKKADLILITHAHYDHMSPTDIQKIIVDETSIVTIQECRNNLTSIAPKEFVIMKAGDTTTVKGVNITAVPAYNPNKEFHPKDSGGIGFIIELDGKKIYHTGDTDFIPEMHDITCDIALLPCGGKYTMNPIEANKAIQAIKPNTVIPMHWGSIVGTKEDAEHLLELAGGIVHILEPEN